MSNLMPGKRLEFPNGWAIDVHEINLQTGEVCYQKWPPGVQSQSMFANLGRMSADEFETVAIGGAYA